MIELKVINNQVKVEGITPSNLSEFYNSYDRALSVRNGEDLLDWLFETNKLTNNELQSLKLMLNSNDIEDFNMALILIKNKNVNKII
jgi:hypothetical protein